MCVDGAELAIFDELELSFPAPANLAPILRTVTAEK